LTTHWENGAVAHKFAIAVPNGKIFGLEIFVFCKTLVSFILDNTANFG